MDRCYHLHHHNRHHCSHNPMVQCKLVLLMLIQIHRHLHLHNKCSKHLHLLTHHNRHRIRYKSLLHQGKWWMMHHCNHHRCSHNLQVCCKLVLLMLIQIHRHLYLGNRCSIILHRWIHRNHHPLHCRFPQAHQRCWLNR